MLALRTSFVALVYEDDDPVLEEIQIHGGLDDFPQYPGNQVYSETRRFTDGQTMSMSCWVWSKTQDEIYDAFTPTWQKSTDEGASWAAVNISVTRITVYWSAGTASTTAARADSQYFDVSNITLQGFTPQDAGLYRLKVVGGEISPAYSANFARIRYDSNPG